MSRPRAVVVVGDLVEDVIVWHEGPIEHATDNPAQIFRTRGGSAANVAVVAAETHPTTFVGRVGADPLGDSLLNQLRTAGVNPVVQRGGRTGTVICLVDETGERTMFPDRAAATDLQALDPNVLDGAAWLHAPLYGFETPGSAAAITDLVRRARERDIPVSIDLSSVASLRRLTRERVRVVLNEIQPTHIFANSAEAAYGEIESFRTDRVTLVVKNGPDPVRIVHGRDEEFVAVPPVESVRDATGAGDAFAGAFIALAATGAPVGACARAASARAAQVLATAGAGAN